jgi:hypothetical protein
LGGNDDDGDDDGEEGARTEAREETRRKALNLLAGSFPSGPASPTWAYLG